MNQKTVKTAAFAFLGPDALRIVLANKGYHVSIYTGDPKVLSLLPDRKNVVILPTIAKRDDLYKYADRIKYLLIHTEGKYKEAYALGIPILDAKVQDDNITLRSGSTPAEYINRIKIKSVPLALTSSETTVPTSNKIKRAWPNTYYEWLSLLERVIPNTCNFNEVIEKPVFNWFAQIAGKDEIRDKLKNAIVDKRTKRAITVFFKWLVGSEGTALSKAYIAFTTNKDAVYDIADKFSVSADDLLLLYSTEKMVTG